jgi:hypothetical protein
VRAKQHSAEGKGALGARNGTAWFAAAGAGNSLADAAPGDLGALAAQVDAQLLLLGALEALTCEAKELAAYILAVLSEIQARLAAPQPCAYCAPASVAPGLGATYIIGTPVTVGGTTPTTPVAPAGPTYAATSPPGVRRLRLRRLAPAQPAGRGGRSW